MLKCLLKVRGIAVYYGRIVDDLAKNAVPGRVLTPALYQQEQQF